MERRFAVAGALDMARTVRFLGSGAGDPRFRVEGEAVWRSLRTPAGPATVRLEQAGAAVAATAWGGGAEWALDQAEWLVGAGDDPASFIPDHPLIRDLHRRSPGLRFGATGLVVPELLHVILGQKVTRREAHRSYRALVHAYGEPAPGPAGLLLSPDPTLLASLPYEEFHPLGIERKRAEVVRFVCRRARRLEETMAMDDEAAACRLAAFPGIGPWTTAVVMGVARGDADAVPVGDFHLPNMVAWALAGEPRGDDDRMLELLQPFAGHRGRVLRLLKLAGISAPKYGPRSPLRSITGI